MGNSDVDVKKPTNGKSKKRRGAFPRVALKSVIELLDGIYELGHGDPVRRRTSLEHIGRSPDSSTSYMLIAASNGGYDLIKGNKISTYFELKPKGLRIVEAQSSAERNEAIIDTLFANHYFAALVDKYSDKPMPLDSIAVDFLQREHDLEKTDAEACWSIAKENIFDFGLYEESGNKQVILAREHLTSLKDPEFRDDDHQQFEDETSNFAPDEFDEAEPPRKRQGQQRSYRGFPTGQINPQITFNIQVVMPENATPEVYDAIFESMANHLLRRNEDG